MALKTMVSNELNAFFENNVHVSSRTLYFGGDMSGGESEINAAFAAKAIKGLHFLDIISHDPIRVILSSEGGSWYDMAGIYDFIQQLKSLVSIDAFGPVFSAGSLLLQAATLERRISKNSKCMIHYGIFSIDDYSSFAKNWSREMDRTDQELEDIYLNRIIVKNPDFKREKLKEMLSVDTILTSAETVSMGLADSII